MAGEVSSCCEIVSMEFEVIGERGGEGGQTTVVFAIVVDHEHDLPLEGVVIDQSTRNAREILRFLHFLELAEQKPCCSC